MAGKKVTMYEWPSSQKCMECAHSEFVMSDTLTNSDYVCHEACEDNDGVSCSKFKPAPKKFECADCLKTFTSEDEEPEHCYHCGVVPENGFEEVS